DGKGGEVVTLPMPAAMPAPGPKPVRALPAATNSFTAPSETAPQIEAIGAGPSSRIAFSAIEPAFSPSPPLEERVGERRIFAGDLEQLWTSLVDAVGRASPFTRTY